MSEEIPIWVNGIIQWVSGVHRKTTCRDIIEAVLQSEGTATTNVKDYTIMERWRRVERPLDENSKILKIWSHWGDEKKEVRLCLKRINNEIDSGRGSPVGIVNTPSLKRRRHHRSRGNGKPPWSQYDTFHPKRLAQLRQFNSEEFDYETQKLKQQNTSDDHLWDSRRCLDDEKVNSSKTDEATRQKTGHKSYHCPGSGVLHSTLLSANEKPINSKCCSKRQSKTKVRNSENIEKLMKLILAQGATIQSQLQKLREREEQIESIEYERHRERVEKNGRNYLLETYLGSLNEAEIPITEEERGNESSVHTERQISDQINKETRLPTEVNGTDGTKEFLDGDKLAHRESRNRSLPCRGKRSRSENRSIKYDNKEKDNTCYLKRTLSDNDLAGNCDNQENSKGEEIKEDANDVLILKRIQSQLEMWEKVFRINKKLEKEEENLVRLHIKIKRSQTENLKLTKFDDEEIEENKIEQDRKVIEKDLEILRQDLDQNSKEIYQNFTKLQENDEVVEQKRSILKRLINDLEKTEQEHNLLSEMVQALPEDNKGSEKDFKTFSLGRRIDEEETVLNNTPEVVPIRLFNIQHTEKDRLIPMSNSYAKSTLNEITINQRIEEKEVKPKNVKISFDDKIEDSEKRVVYNEKLGERVSNTPTTIRGILKNRNPDVGEQCEILTNSSWNISLLSERTPQEYFFKGKYQFSEGATENEYQVFSNTVKTLTSEQSYEGSHDSYLLSSLNNREIHAMKQKYVNNFKSDSNCQAKEQTIYENRNIISNKTSVHNDTDSNTSSDTSGMCSMYSSSPTVEESYAEPTYVLDTLV